MNIKLLKNLDFPKIVTNAKPVTESGRELMKNYQGYLFSNESSYSLVNNFIREARAYAYDPGVNKALEQVLKFITERNISWKLASASEIVCESRPAFDAISKNAVAQVDKMLEALNENQVRQYIKAGALKNIQYIPEFRQICKGVYSESVTEAVAVNYTMTSPVLFCEGKNGAVYFQVDNKVYKQDKGRVSESVAPSRSFSQINALLGCMERNGEGMRYVYESRGLTFDITAESIKATKKDGKSETFTESAKFNEWRDLVCRGVMGNAGKTEFMRVTENLLTVWDNFDSVVESDQVHIVNTTAGSRVVIVEGQKNVIISKTTSASGKSYRSYSTMVEALRDIEKTEKINLQPVFESRIAADAKKNVDKETRRQMNIIKESQLSERRKRIEQLTEAHKNEPAVLAVLNKLAKELSKA